MVIPDDAPQLVDVPRMSQSINKINPIIFLQISELACVYCFICCRYLHDPEDLLEESVGELVQISSAFSPTEQSKNLNFDNVDEMFWVTYDKMRCLADDDQVALEAFQQAAVICQKTIKIRYALSHIICLLKKSLRNKKSQQLKLAKKKMEFYLSWVLGKFHIYNDGYNKYLIFTQNQLFQMKIML